MIVIKEGKIPDNTKLDNAGIPTRTVFFCKEDKKQYDGQF